MLLSRAPVFEREVNSEGRDTEDYKQSFCLVMMKTDEGMEQVKNPLMSGNCLSIIMIKEEFSIDNKTVRQM
jgi:hypothetical protein